MRVFTFVILLLSSFLAYSEDQSISVPGEGWRIRFDAPKLTPIPGPVPSVFYGKADRFQLSLFVEKPRCDGPDTNENIYACHLKKVLANPYVVSDSVRGYTTTNGVQTMAFYRIQTAAGVGTNFSMNLLFARKGKWANVHASFASPTPDDAKALYTIMDSIKIEDDVESGAPSSSPETSK
jgi:hypothetical protein